MSTVEICKDCRESHKENVSGYCKKCQVTTCNFCVALSHYDHHEALVPYDMQLAQSVNSYVKKKGIVSRMLSIYEQDVKNADIEQARKDAELRVRNSYANFRLALKNHLTNYIQEIRNSKFVKKLKSQQYSLTVGRVEVLKSMHKELSNDLSGLMDAVCEAKYAGQLSRVQAVESLRAKLDSLEKAQTCEQQNFDDGLQKLSSLTIQSSPPHGLLNVRNIDKICPSVYKVDRETSSLIKYGLVSRTVNALTFVGYTFPYNSSIVEISGTIYVIGGCLSDGTPDEESAYTDQITELDPYLNIAKKKGTLARKRMCFGAVAAEGLVVYVVGGYNHNGLLAQCEKFSLLTQHSEEIAALGGKRSNCGLCILQNRYLYCVGGYSAIDGDCSCIEMLDLQTKQESGWVDVLRREATDWEGVQNPGIVAVSPREILIFGGRRKGETVDDAMLFVPEERKFVAVEHMQDCDTFLTCRPTVYQMKVYTFGCHEDHLHIYDIKDKCWEIRTNLIKHSTPKRSSTPKHSRSGIDQ